MVPPLPVALNANVFACAACATTSVAKTTATAIRRGAVGNSRAFGARSRCRMDHSTVVIGGLEISDCRFQISDLDFRFGLQIWTSDLNHLAGIHPVVRVE